MRPKDVSEALTEGGLPPLTLATLAYLGSQHFKLALHSADSRGAWHLRWAFLCEDLRVTLTQERGGRRG